MVPHPSAHLTFTLALFGTVMVLMLAVRNPAILARIPAGRWGVPDDFKGAVVYLASKASDYMNGSILTIDGGWMGR